MSGFSESSFCDEVFAGASDRLFDDNNRDRRGWKWKRVSYSQIKTNGGPSISTNI